jgi:F-type H+-transporting ATPase subunit epsilon
MADKLLELSIVTPDKEVFAGKADAVWLPGSKAPFEVLYNHAPIVSGLSAGEIRVRDDKGKILEFSSGRGFAEVSNNVITVLTDSAEEK